MNEVRHEDEFDCIRCGARVYHAANQCPRCGLELYPEGPDEDEDPPASAAPTGGGWFATMRGPLLAGIAAVVLLAFVLPLLSAAVPGLPVAPVAGIFLVVCIAAGVVLHRRGRRGPSADDGLYLELLQCTGFDQARAARMVEMERQQTPNAPRRELLRRAIARWRRDNH